ncbi:MAG: hypothetical protein ACLU8J_05780 [Acutalibacter sp.]
MKAFLKTYWLELALFAVALVGEVMVLPFLPESVPVYWNIPFCQAPKWTLLLLTVTQLPGACLVRFGLHLILQSILRWRSPSAAWSVWCPRFFQWR